MPGSWVGLQVPGAGGHLAGGPQKPRTKKGPIFKLELVIVFFVQCRTIFLASMGRIELH